MCRRYAALIIRFSIMLPNYRRYAAKIYQFQEVA